MSESKKPIEIENLFCTRKLPNSSFLHQTATVNTNEKKDGMYVKPSFTDKEAYKLTLASMRGDNKNIVEKFLSGNLTSNKGYSIPAGKNINDVIDSSYLRRPDLTLADIDDYIARTKSLLESADNELKIQIENEIASAESKKAELAKAESKSKENSSSEE